MNTYQIHINGIVQGVGFRPTVYRLATEMRLDGYVKNGSDGVHIFFNASEERANLFFKRIEQSAPSQSRILSSRLYNVEDTLFSGFSIVVEDDHSGEKAHRHEKKVLISPDTAICALCRIELHDRNNRRYRYPFITCTQCGPRYSIIDSLPYERRSTSMKHFSMCKSCDDEYKDVSDRRFFSQTNSCDECGVELCIRENADSILTGDSGEVLSQVNDLLKRGKILAIKGIGGYLLLCDAMDASAIRSLRSRKHRPSKPFAVLYPDERSIRNDFECSEQEKALLESREAPIVLLRPKRDAWHNIVIEDVAPGLNRLGIMLPYSPLLELITSDFGKPLVATSANSSGSPIIYKDEEALAYLFGIADYVVSYNREIVIPQDDSVIEVSKFFNRKIILRRSRGHAPSFLRHRLRSKTCMLSTGAVLKSSFALSVNGNVFISQFLGSSESYEAQQMYKDTLCHWLKLYGVKPEKVVSDLHPDYFSHRYAVELASESGTDPEFIQHHEAHFAAVLAENDLLHASEPVLGVIWDGTGLGSDENIWGGEFFKYENNTMIRCHHFDYFPAIAGDKLAMEPRIAALCAAGNAGLQSDKLKRKFTETE